MPVAWVFRFRDGKVAYMRAYRDPREALEAAGLSD
jgi:ketosteroid isomerase-like protein